MTTYSFNIPLEPIAKSRPRAYLRNNHIHFYTETSITTYEKKVKQIALQHIQTPLSTALHLLLLFKLSKPKSAKREFPTVRPDLDNLEKTVLDALNKVAYNDDSQVICVTKMKRYISLGESPCTEITIIEI